MFQPTFSIRFQNFEISNTLNTHILLSVFKLFDIKDSFNNLKKMYT